MTMNRRSVIIIEFFIFLNVSVFLHHVATESYDENTYEYDESVDVITASTTQKIEKAAASVEVLAPNYDILKSSACLDQFAPKMQSFIFDIKNKSLSCAENAENLIKLEMASVIEYRWKFLQKLNATQSSLHTCTQKANAFKYLDCLRGFSAVSREVLHEMDLKTERFSNQINQIENDKNNCSNKSVDDNELKSTSVYSELRKCLLSDINPSTESQNNVEMLSHLNEILNIYHQIKPCLAKYTSGQHVEKYCLEDALLEMGELNIKEVLTKNSGKYFSKLFETDLKEDRCLRHFVTKHIFPNFHFDWQSCVKNGYKSMSTQRTDNIHLNHGLKEIVNSLKACKNHRSSSQIVGCIYDVVLKKDLESSFELQINLKSEEQLKNLNRNEKNFVFDDVCMGYFWRRLQFRGLGMDKDTATNLENCLYRFYT